MSTFGKVHLLSQELIPIIDELDPEPKQVVLEHIENCESCQKLYADTMDHAEYLPEANFSTDVEIKPLKKLARFNTGLRLLLIAIRVLILSYVLLSSFRFWSSAEDIIFTVQSLVYLFYLPAAIFLLVFTMIFFNKKWVWISLAVDVIVIFLLKHILQLFL